MTNSLREELLNIVFRHDTLPSEKVDEIISKIEKRIDTIRQIYSGEDTDTNEIRLQIASIDVFYREIKELLK